MPKPNKPEQGSANALPLQCRAATVSTVNEETRTVDLVWTTGATVRRYDYWRECYYDEQLVVTSDACDLTRLNSGAPLLNQHSQWSLEAVLGVVERAWIEGGEGKATVRFAKAGDHPDADRVFRMIQDGVIRNVSVGYSIQKIERVPPTDSSVAIYRAVRWQPSEISIVAIGADAKAGIRGNEAAQTFPYTLVERAAPETQESTMDEDEITSSAPAAPVAEIRNAPAAIPAPITTPATAANAPAEIAWRASDIARLNARAAAFGLSAADAVTVMASARTLEEATDALQARAAAGNAPRQTPQVTVTTDEGDTLRAAVENAILHRSAPGAVQLSDAGRQFRAMSLLEVGAAFIEASGGNLRGLGKMERAAALLGMTRAPGMLSTSDFASVLANIAGKRLRDAYGSAVQTWRPFCRQSNLPDFKERAIVALSGIPELKKIREGEEYTFAKLGDSVVKYSLATYGRKIAITRQTLINDDLSAFDRLPSLFGRAAAELESDIVWGILLNNPQMPDGKALFHADHNNLAGAGAAPGEGTVAAMEEALGAQKGEADKPLNIRLKYVAASRKHKNDVLKLIGAITPTKSNDISIYQNSLVPIFEDRLYKPGGGASPWFGIGDPAQMDTVEYAYLDGEEGLYTEQRVGFDIDGVEIKGRLDFAAAPIDYRAFQKNPGN